MALNFIQKPYLSFLLGFIISIAYIPGITGAAVPTGWFVLIIVMPILFCFCDFNLNDNNLIGLLFIGYAALSLIWAPSFDIAFFIFLQIVALSCTFCFGENLKDITNCFKGLSLGLGFSSIVALMQYFELYNINKYIFTLYSPIAGIFVNPNIYSEVSALMLLSLIVLKLWWWIPVTLPGLTIIHSRTALLGLGVGLFFWLFNKNKLMAVGSVLLIILFTAFYYREYFSMESINERFSLWADTIRGLTLLGFGIGSYELMYPLNAINIDTSVARPKFAHNDFLQMMFELGIGSILLGILILNILRIKHETRTILVGIGVISLSSYPFHGVPMSAFIGCLVAGFVNRNNAANWNFRFSWRSNLFNRNQNRGFGLYQSS